MPKSTKDYGLKFKCDHCKVAGELKFSAWMVRITGALEIVCPRCKRISIFIGKFGQELHLERAMQDIRENIPSEESRKNELRGDVESGR